ncbi:MAG TPA: hypothetical protein VFB52_01815 [Solirubrobacterales bacterium]|nr:hypothetical protein [Solirubrobacterales bacterium]
MAAVAVAGYAIGAGGSSKNLVLCAEKKDGDLALASAKGKCAKGEKKLTVAKEGPVGPQGAPGPAGADANATLEAVHYVTGPPNPKCFEQAATFCKGESLSGGWRNLSQYVSGYEDVGFYKEANGTVHLVGTAYYSSSGGESGGFEPEGPFYLPPGFRPAKTLGFTAPGAGGQSLAGTAPVLIRPNGAVAILSPVESVALDGISFRTP